MDCPTILFVRQMNRLWGDSELNSRRAHLDEILPLRHRVLRSGFPVDAARFSEDSDARTLHYGLFDATDARVCLTLIPNELNGEKAWQLRGMAADVAVQGMGLGGQLIQFALRDALTEGYSTIFWCNARKAAVSFYVKNGWKVISEEFEVPIFGPHYRMENSI
jgi:GNAT superfamily N-acetyltransferase